MKARVDGQSGNRNRFTLLKAALAGLGLAYLSEDTVKSQSRLGAPQPFLDLEFPAAGLGNGQHSIQLR